MQKLGKNGYFDTNVLTSFFGSFQKGRLPRFPRQKKESIPLTEQRRNQYLSHIQTWIQMLDVIQDIKDVCYEGRTTHKGA